MGTLFNVLKVVWAIFNFKKSDPPVPISVKPVLVPATEPKPEPRPEPKPAEIMTVTPITIPPDILKQGWSKSIEHCNKKLQDAYNYALPKFLGAHPSLGARCDYTWRSPDFQRELYARGRKFENGVWTIVDPKIIVTQNLVSHHNPFPASAFDFIIFRGKIPLWITKENAQEVIALYKKFGTFCQEKGVVSGALWKFTWKDWSHIQGSYDSVKI